MIICALFAYKSAVILIWDSDAPESAVSVIPNSAFFACSVRTLSSLSEVLYVVHTSAKIFIWDSVAPKSAVILICASIARKSALSSLYVLYCL